MEPVAMDDQPMSPSQKKTQLRPKWSSGFESKLALIASLVSPFDFFLLATYFVIFGGAPIFLPLLFVFLALVAVPMLLLEVAVGQYTSRGVWCAWNIAPIFKGIGYVVTVMSGHAAFIGFWYLMAHIVFCYDLATASADEISIFSHCGDRGNGSAPGDYYDQHLDGPDMFYNQTAPGHCEMDTIFSKRWDRWFSPYPYDASTQGAIPQPAQLVAMLLAILASCGLVAAGRRALAVTSAVCVLVPVPLILMLMVRVLTLPGATDGLTFGFYPDVHKLEDVYLYRQAGLVALYLLAATQGRTLTAASYNGFNNCFLIDCLLAVAFRLACLLVCDITTLGAVGALAHAKGLPFGEIFTGGIELVSLVTETLLLHTPAGGFWTACFIICILLSCLIYAVWTVHTTVTAIWDILPHTPRFKTLLRKPVLVGVFAVPWLLYSIGYCTKRSWSNVVMQDNVVHSPFTTLVMCGLECAAVAGVFGARRFQACWSAMQGRLCGCPYPLLFWAIITPVVATVSLIINFATFGYYDIPALSSLVFALLVIFISAIVLLFTRPGFMGQKWRIMTTPWDLAPYQMQPTHGRYQTVAMSSMLN